MQTAIESKFIGRLNPFRFPSNTSFRFLLLILSVLGVSAFVYDSMYFSYHGRNYFDSMVLCRNYAQSADPGGGDLNQKLFNACMAPVRGEELLWSLIWLGILFFLAAMIYFIEPHWKIWRRRLIPLNSEDFPEVNASLFELSSEIGLKRPPRFLLDPLAGSASGMCFGHIGFTCLVVNAGLVTQFYRDRGIFRAVALHELAHVRNADVDIANFSIAIWRSFILAAILPISISIIFPPAGMARGDLSYLLELFFRIGLATGMIFLIYKSILRVREYYADVQASIFDGPAGSLKSVLARMIGHRKSGFSFLQSHPNPGTRQKVIQEPMPLFYAGFWDAFATGYTAMIGFPAIQNLLNLIFQDLGHLPGSLTAGELSSLGAALIYMAPVAAFIVIGIWREQYASLMMNSFRRGIIGMVTGIFLGLFTGMFFAPNNILNPNPDEFSSLFIHSFLSAVFLILLLYHLARWVVVTTSIWQVHTIDRSSQRSLYVTVAVMVVLLVIMIGRFYLLFMLGDSISRKGGLAFAFIYDLQAISSFITDPLSILCYFGLSFIPVMGLIQNRKLSSFPANLVFLDKTNSTLTLHRPNYHHWGGSTLVWLVGTFLTWGYLTLAGLIAHFGMSGIIPTGTDHSMGFFYLLCGIAAVGQLLVAVLIMSLSNDHTGAAYSLSMAFLCGFASVAWLTIFRIAVGGYMGWEVAWLFFSYEISIGTLLTVVFVLGILVLKNWFGRIDMARVEYSTAEMGEA